jgi:hypothetical protein
MESGDAHGTQLSAFNGANQLIRAKSGFETASINMH